VSLIDIYPTMLDLCHLPNVKGLEGTSLLPLLEDPSYRRREPVITTWYYNNHAARSLNFRYIRYRDGSEELYDHRPDPNEQQNIAGDPERASIKEKLGAAMPEKDVVPSSIKDGDNDSFGKKVELLRSEGVPAWLGTTPGSTTD
jgi:iduronate 2-sulfatase